MQNIPGIPLKDPTEKLSAPTFSAVGRNDRQSMFAEVFAMHSASVENELSLAPMTTREKMLDAAPVRQDETRAVADEAMPRPREAGREAAREAIRPARDARDAKKDERADRAEHDERMTQEDFEKVKEDLKAYGLTDDEIKAFEKKIASDEGMTWKEFVAALSQKMEMARKAALGDEHKEALGSFFAKLGFTAEESATLIARLENGEQDKVMAELQARLAELPKTRQLLLTKEEVVAFSSAMGFSGEFTAKLKAMVGSTTTSKELREAFTLIRQEMADMDAKDRSLVRAVGKAFAGAMGEQARENSAARNLEAAVDLKPRVAEDTPRAEARAQIREDFKEAVESRKEQAGAEVARKGGSQPLPEKSGEPLADNGQRKPGQHRTGAGPETRPETRPEARNEAESDSDKAWNNFFGKLRDDSAASRAQARTETMEHTLRADAADMASKAQNRAWEKVDAPRVMRQVENAVFRNLTNGTRQLTLQLTPENLGKLSIVLQVQGKEVNAVIRADNAEAARVINENIEVIRGALEGQGLKVEKLDVQTGLTGNQDNSWAGSEQHNLARDREIMTAMRRHMRAMRGETGGEKAAGSIEPVHAPSTENGIHVIA